MIEKKHDSSVRTSPTSVDVARRAGVSRTTVSYVLNENGHGHVSDETRMKVLQAAHEMSYNTHFSARALRKGQSDEICLIVDLPLTIHRTELFVSLQQHALHYGYPAVVYFSHGLPPDQVEKQLFKIFARRPIGIFATAESMTAEHVALAKSMGVNNIVLYSVKPITYARTIILPTMDAGRLAALHLIERGHRHLGLVHPAEPLHQYDFCVVWKGCAQSFLTYQKRHSTSSPLSTHCPLLMPSLIALSWELVIQLAFMATMTSMPCSCWGHCLTEGNRCHRT